MTIPPDLESRILRYYHAEQWRVGTIATLRIPDEGDRRFRSNVTADSGGS